MCATKRSKIKAIVVGTGESIQGRSPIDATFVRRYSLNQMIFTDTGKDTLEKIHIHIGVFCVGGGSLSPGNSVPT